MEREDAVAMVDQWERRSREPILWYTRGQLYVRAAWHLIEAHRRALNMNFDGVSLDSPEGMAFQDLEMNVPALVMASYGIEMMLKALVVQKYGKIDDYEHHDLVLLAQAADFEAADERMMAMLSNYAGWARYGVDRVPQKKLAAGYQRYKQRVLECITKPSVLWRDLHPKSDEHLPRFVGDRRSLFEEHAGTPALEVFAKVEEIRDHLFTAFNERRRAKEAARAQSWSASGKRPIA